MILKRKQTFFLLTLSSAAMLLTGCGVPYQSGLPICDENLSARLRSTLEGMYPHSARITERAIVTSARGEMVFTGVAYVSRDTDRTMRLVGLGDFGKVLFSVARSPEGKFIAERDPFNIGIKQLAYGPLQDVNFLYQPTSATNATLERRDVNTVSLVNLSADGWREEFRFDTRDYRWIGYYRVRDNRCFYAVTFSNYQKLSNWNNPVPGEIALQNYKMNYSACINVVDIIPNPNCSQAMEATTLEN